MSALRIVRIQPHAGRMHSPPRGVTGRQCGLLPNYCGIVCGYLIVIAIIRITH